MSPALRYTYFALALGAACTRSTPRDVQTTDAGTGVPAAPDGDSGSAGAVIAGTGGAAGAGMGGAGAGSAGAGSHASGAPAELPPWPALAFSQRVLVNLPVAPPVACGAADACAPGQRCFHLTQDIAFCDAPEHELATTCEVPSGMDDSIRDCACEGVTCSDDQRCIASQITCSCAPRYVNRCVDTPCSSPSDCPEGSVCRPTSFIFDNDDPLPVDGSDDRSRCLAAPCQSDADCSLVANGRCAVIVTHADQGGSSRVRLWCVYAALGGEVCPEGASLSVGGGFERVCLAEQ